MPRPASRSRAGRRTASLLLGVALWGSGQARAACPDEATDAVSLDAAATVALEAYGAMFTVRTAEEDQLAQRAFRRAADAVLDRIPCATEVLPRPTVGRIHQVAGLVELLDQDDDGREAAWMAARRVLGDAPLQVPGLTDRQREARRYAAIPKVPVEGIAVAPPARGTFYWDGVQGLARPTPGATLWQHEGGDGSVLSTALLAPHDALPFYESKAPSTPSEPTSATRPRRSGAGWALVGVGAAAAVAGAILTGTTLSLSGRACTADGSTLRCAADGDATGTEVSNAVATGLNAGVPLLAAGVAVAIGGGSWVAVSGRPGQATMRLTMAW